MKNKRKVNFSCFPYKMEKRGWIRIVEAFVAILLIAGVLLIVLNKGYLSKDVSGEVYDKELTVLRGIQTDDSFRNQILSINENLLPVSWGDAVFPEEVKKRITTSMGETLDCSAMICSLDEICVLSQYSEESIYSRAIAITANITEYSPKQLKLFCSSK